MGAPASPSGSRASTEPSSTVSALTGFDPSRKFGPLGLTIIDELAIEGLATCLERLIVNQCHGGERDRLRHALATFLIRAQVGGDWKAEDATE